MLRGQNAAVQGLGSWARLHFEADLARNPERVESWIGLGKAYLSGAEGSAAGAIQAFSRALDLREDPEARRLLARAHLLRGEDADALNALEPLNSDSATAETRFLRARAWLASDPREAFAALSPSADPSSVDPSPWTLEARASAAEIFARLGDDERALETADAVLRDDPFRPETAYLRLSLLRRHEDLLADARRAYEIVRSPGPNLAQLDELASLLGAGDSPTLLLRRASILAGRAQVDEELGSLIDRLSTARAAIPGRLDLARRLAEGERPWLARQLLQSVLDEDPEHVGALTQAARLELQTGDLRLARERLDALTKVFPESAAAASLEGRIALTEGREDDALREWTRALELAPWDAGLRVETADLLLASARRSDAEELISAAPAADPRLAAWTARNAR